MIPYGRQDISQADIEAVVKVLRSDLLTQGPTVPSFEQAVAEYCGARYGVAVNSATSALHIACLALGVGPGDWVWTSPNTFVASANCAVYCGANIDFVDIDPHTYNISVDLLARKLGQAAIDHRLPKVVIPVHFAGQSCDMEPINDLGKEYGFRIIEDASHAIGAKYLHTKVGSSRYCDITVFSFHPVKIITTGEGGIAVTNNAELAERMSLHRSHGVTSKADLMQPRSSSEIWNYQQITIGHNYRMTDLQAALGISQLSRINKFVDRRRQIALRYDDAFSNLPLIRPCQLPQSESSYHLYPVRIRESLSGKTQLQIYSSLLSAGIGVNLHYIPVYLHPFYRQMGFNVGYCPESELYYREVISLPIYPAMTDDQYDHVIRTMRSLFT